MLSVKEVGMHSNHGAFLHSTKHSPPSEE